MTGTTANTFVGLVPVGVTFPTVTSVLNVRRLVDASPSIQSSRLVRSMVLANERIELAIATANPRNRQSRAIFHNQHIDADRGQFLDAKGVNTYPFASFYEIGGTDREGHNTYLDRYLNRELRSLISRYDANSSEYHILWVITDGYNNGPDRTGKICEKMGEVLARANLCGGVLRSRLVVFYVGLGGSLHHHLEVASVRYKIPKEWVLWQEATEQGIDSVTQTSVTTFQRLAHGDESRFSN